MYAIASFQICPYSLMNYIHDKVEITFNFKVCILVAVNLIENYCFLTTYSKLLHSNVLILLNALTIKYSISERWITSSGLLFF